jgi:pilus assembly protein CpaC
MRIAMKKVFLFLVPALLLQTVCALPQAGSADSFGEEVVLYMGEPKLFPVSNLRRVAIGNPAIADVTNISAAEVTLVPKASGSTTLLVWDSMGEQVYQLRVYPEHAIDVKRRIDGLLAKLNLEEVFTQAAEEEGKVLLLGRVKVPQDKERIVIALGPLYEKTTDLIQIREEESVIAIDVQVLELNKDATKVLGLSWPGSIDITEVGSPGISDTGAKPSTLWSVLNFKRTALSVTLDALIEEGKAKVLSRPRLSCQSGKEAELMVGGEKPILTTQTVSSGGTATEVDYKEFGIKLNIKPTVTDVDRIKLGVMVEVSEVEEAEVLGLVSAPTARAYPLTKRTASTELFLDDGQTLSIGGLVKQRTEEDVRRTPFLSDIPVLGWLFKQTTTRIGGGNTERGDTELFITITPTIVTREKKTAVVLPAAAVETVPAQQAVADPLVAYGKLVKDRILENVAYPESARQAGFQGTVKLGVHLSFVGKPLGIVVRQSSGHEILDEQAVEAAQRVEMFPPFPVTIAEEDLWIDIPVDFQLG